MDECILIQYKNILVNYAFADVINLQKALMADNFDVLIKLIR